jgi:CDP-diacylglycerol---glycerol-3-phosphate 3-phosphatidyltransferase
MAGPLAYYSTSSFASSNLHSSIEQLSKNLDSLAPRFELQAGELQVLTTPEEFYDALRKKILSAKRRVFLSSLYVGKEETELV